MPIERRLIPIPAAIACAGFIAALVLSACSDTKPATYQGYVEGEFVYVASPVAGRLDHLLVKRGDLVTLNAPLFALESENEAAAQRQAQQQLNAAEAQLKDLQRGKRPQEINVSAAQLAQARADQDKSAIQLARDEAQYKIGGIAKAQLDDSRAAHAANVAHVAQLQSELEVARLPSRDDQVRAQSAQVAAARAALDQANWKLDQKSVAATRSGRVFDTMYREGEWVAAGSPIVRMLPPQNVKVRFFVPETLVGSLALGRALTIHCDGCAAEIPATVTFVANESEFTPPVIYSNETRAKLVFMIEAHPTPENAERLRPGQPVSVGLQ